MSKIFIVFSLLFTVLFANTTSPKLDQSINVSIKSQQASTKSQSKVDALHAKEQELFAEYKATLQEIETLKVYNQQLQSLVDEQNKEMQSLNEQIVEVDITAQGIMPLMKDMIEAFKSFTDLDTPFLQQERAARYQRLSTLLSKPKLTVSQKYRSIMEAYAIELEYGNTLETYTAQKETTTVNFLKVGRIGLYYLSLDEKEVGMYDITKKAFITLDESVIKPLKRAIKIAKKQQAPDLLELPIILTQHDIKGAK
jgi:hypothetical protein